MTAEPDPRSIRPPEKTEVLISHSDEGDFGTDKSEVDPALEQYMVDCGADFCWLIEGNVQGRADGSVWVIDSPMPELSRWKVGKVPGSPDPAPAAHGPRLLILDSDRKLLTCFYPLSSKAHEPAPATGDRPPLPFVVGAFEFGVDPGNPFLGVPSAALARHKDFYTACDFVTAISRSLDAVKVNIREIASDLAAIGRGDLRGRSVHEAEILWLAMDVLEHRARFELVRGMLEDRMVSRYEHRLNQGDSTFDASWFDGLDEIGIKFHEVGEFLRRGQQTRERRQAKSGESGV